MKRLLLALTAAILLSAMVFSGCGTPDASGDTPASSEASAAKQLELTVDELSTYDGQNGNPAYIAVDGVIYDVTEVPQWKGGMHNGFSAGNDLTSELNNISPHGASKLRGIPVAGTLVE